MHRNVAILTQISIYPGGNGYFPDLYPYYCGVKFSEHGIIRLFFPLQIRNTRNLKIRFLRQYEYVR